MFMQHFLIMFPGSLNRSAPKLHDRGLHLHHRFTGSASENETDILGKVSIFCCDVWRKLELFKSFLIPVLL